VTIALPIYENVVEDAKAITCEANVKALSLALGIYAMEHDALPGSISQLPSEYIKRAFVTLLQQKDAWKIRLAYAIVDWQKRREGKGFAYAQGGVPATTHFLRDVISRGDFKMVTCPSDKRSLSDRPGGSYGVNAALQSMKYSEFQDLPPYTLIVADCNNPTFNENDPSTLAFRHKRHYFMNVRYYAIIATADNDAERHHVTGVADCRTQKKTCQQVCETNYARGTSGRKTCFKVCREQFFKCKKD
jgi:hypothetical protein